MSHLLCRSECEEILRAENVGDHLISFDLQPATDVVGFLGSYHTLTIGYAARHDNGKASPISHKQYFVKSVPLSNAEEAKGQIFAKEATLYRSLLLRMQRYALVKFSPRCFLARDDLIVLEDLRQCSYKTRQNPEHDNMQDEEIFQLLRGLAAVHAASIILEEKEVMNIGETHGSALEEITVHPKVPWYTVGIEALKELVAQYRHISLEDELYSIYEMINTSQKYRNVFCHRDPWSGNVLFEEDGEDKDQTEKGCLFVDFQTARYCPPAVDVIFAIYMNQNRSNRLARETVYVQRYYEEFSKNLLRYGLNPVMVLSEKEFLECYQKLRLFASVYRFLAATILKVSRHLVTNEYVHVDRTKALLKFMQQNDDFRNHLNECMDEIVAELNRN